MLTASIPAVLRAVNDAAGDRKWKFLPGTGAPRSVMAVSRLTTARSAPDSTGVTGASTWAGSALSWSANGVPEEMAVGSVSRMSGNWVSPAKAKVTAPGSTAVLVGVLSPPVPYQMRVDVELDVCERPSLLDAAVHGDLEGRARLRMVPADGGTDVAAPWTFEMMQRPMRIAARIAHPLLRWGHDRVVEVTVNAFRRHIAVRT